MHQIPDCPSAFNGKVNMAKSHFGHIDFHSLYEICKTYCMPVYGSQLWNYDKHIDTFNVRWPKAMNRLLDLPTTTHCNLLPNICSDIPPNVRLYKRVISFVVSLSKSTNVITSICYRLVANDNGSSVSKTISILSRDVVCTLIICIHYQQKDIPRIYLH